VILPDGCERPSCDDAVGYGQSVYPTFQNVPRLTDKLLEQLGSRRCVRRVELDEGPNSIGQDASVHEPGSSGARDVPADVAQPQEPSVYSRAAGLARFEADVLRALQLASSTATKLPVCPWTVPGDRILEKTSADLAARPEVLEGSSGCSGAAAAVVVAAIAVALICKFSPLLGML